MNDGAGNRPFIRFKQKNMNLIEITEENTPYTLDFSKVVGLGNITSNTIFVTSKNKFSAQNQLILGDINAVEGLPNIEIVVEDSSLEVITTGLDMFAVVGNIQPSIIVFVGYASIRNFISRAKKYWTTIHTGK